MNLNLIICLLAVFIQVKCDCDDYFKCVSDVIKDFFGAKDIINKEDTNKNASDFKNKEETKSEGQNKSISVFEIAIDLEKGLAKILNEATSLIKDENEGQYTIDSEAGPYYTKNNNTEINIHIFNITKPLISNIQKTNLKSTNISQDEIKMKVTDHLPSMETKIDKSVNISESNVTTKLFEELLEQQRDFLNSFMHLNNSNYSTHFDFKSIELEPDEHNNFNKGRSTNFSNPPSKIYLPDKEVHKIFRELMKYHENDDVITDLPKIESNQSFVIEELNDTIIQDLSQFNDLVGELIKIHKNNEATNKQRVQETYDNASRNDINLKRKNVKSSVKVNVEKANVSIITLDNNENNYDKFSKIVNDTFQNRKYLPIKSELLPEVKNATERKEDKKYLPTHSILNLNKTRTNNNKNYNNLTKNYSSVLNSTLYNKNEQQVTKEHTTIKNIQGINENKKYLPAQTNMSQKVIFGKTQLVVDKKTGNSNGDSQKFNETLQNRKYLPMKQKQETDGKQTKTHIIKTIEKAVLETTTAVNSTIEKSKTMENNSLSNKYLPKTPESNINKNSKVNITNNKSNPITKGSAKSDSNSLKIDTIKIMNNTNKQEPTSNDAIKDNEILTDDFERYSDYDDEENSTDYPVIDYIELYKDTTNEKVDYVSTTPADFRSYTDDVIDNKEGEYNGLDGSSLSETIFPWIATIFVKNGSNNQFDYYCDGAILSKNTILTSGRCVSATNFSRTEDFITIVGKRSLQINGGSEMVHRVKQVILHDDFATNENETNNDLAILVLDDYVEFNNNTRSTCVFDSDGEPNEAFTTGWGYTGNLTTIRLQKDQNCKKNPQNTFCTAFGNNVAVCPSHGGIHAAKQADGKFCLSGIRTSDTSARGLCVDRNVVYTDIRVFIEWIEKVINDNKDS